MALAIHFDGLIRDGVVKNYADLARLGGVSRARITQIMNLLNLPPWKQEELLFLEGGQGRDVVTERKMRTEEIQWQLNNRLGIN
jgi:alkylated DNA nucleotide flippase Atl1